MIFSSIAFISVFLPIVFILHQVLPGIKAKNVMLIIFSLAFYAYGEPIYVFLMIASSLWNYFFALGVDKCQDAKKRKAVVVASIVVNLLPLGFFKYTGFLFETINSIFGTELTVPQIALPIGISFFTFQALSYVVDVYRKKVNVEKNYFNVLLYITFFPQLIAGPIVKFHDVNMALSQRHASSTDIANGFRRFICGVGKKVIFANVTGQITDMMFASSVDDMNILSVWLASVACMLRIYYDFSGYSDMAIGMGQMFGFKFLENFNYPYTATSIKEFWSRWHISMFTWFTEYLYYPLGGNRKGVGRARFNMMVVFFMTGLWHGATWAYILWGCMHGVFRVLEDVFKNFFKKLPKVIAYIYTMMVVSIGFSLLCVTSFRDWGVFVGKMFAGFDFSPEAMSIFMQYMTPWNIVILVIAAFGAGPMRYISEKVKAMVLVDNVVGTKAKVLNVSLYVLSIALLIFCMIRLSSDTYNPFIYFRF